ncbi:MAG: rhodanese-like domain-containing protein [Flavobacteriaceae bacterium]
MKKLSIFLVALIISTVAFSSSFTSNLTNLETLTLNPPNEFEVLLEYMETNGNFINTDASTAIINADEVKKNYKSSSYLLIDIRSDSWFEFGHIKNAKNVKAANLLTYFESEINPSDFDKIVMICYSGQSAAYYTGLLRIAGYDNVFSMKWGMSSWRTDFAENSWTKNTTNNFADELELTTNIKSDIGSYPIINTGETEAKDILRVRLEKAFATPYKEYIVKSPEVFENLNDYYIVNYNTVDVYDNGHIPGAIQYEPSTSLSSAIDLNTLPADKKIAIYCLTGQRAAHVVAYLNILGYDTSNIAYGANSFMNKVLKSNKTDAFSKKEINMYPVIE